MGVITKQGSLTTISSYVGLLLGFFSFLVLFPLILTKEQIGLVRILEESTAILATLALAGAPGICVRYFTKFKNPENNNNGFFRLLLYFPLLGTVLVAITMFFFDKQLHHFFADPLLHKYWFLIFPVSVLCMFFIILDVYCRSNYIYFVPAFLRDAAKRLLIILAAITYWLGLCKFSTFIVYIALSHLVILIALVFYMWRQGLLTVRVSPFQFLDKPLRFEMLDVAFYQTLSVIGGFMLTRLDTFMVLAIAGLAETGVYSISAKLILLMDLPRTAIQVVALTLVAQSFKENNIKKIDSLYKQTAINQLIIGSFLLLILWCNVDSIFRLIPNGDSFLSGKITILFLGLAKLIDMSFGINYEILAFSKHYRISAMLNLILMFCAIFINYYFISKFGFIGAGYAAIIIVTTFNLVRFGFLKYKLGLQPFSLNAIWVVVLAAVIGAIDLALPHYNSTVLIAILNIALHSLFIGCSFLFILVRFNLSPEIANFYFRLFNRFKQYFINDKPPL
jgi:O-antigen/teichoic acid export membrane protein